VRLIADILAAHIRLSGRFTHSLEVPTQRARRIAIMSSRLTTAQRSPALPKKPPAKVIAAVSPAVRADVAVDEEARKSEFSIFGDPLWGIAIASGILFATLVALMAVG
jgi:hypothetical protein